MKPELTPLEISIVVLVAQAMDQYVIGAKKGLSSCSIKQHICTIYRKLGFPKSKGSARNAIRLTHYAIQNGYIQAGQCLN